MDDGVWTDKALLDLIIMPSVERLIRKDELESVTITRQTGDRGSRTARIVACSEMLEVIVQYPDSDDSVEDVKCRFFDELQVFVAESNFAWGELRG